MSSTSLARTRDCVVIETSSNVRVGCWDVAYPGLTEQMLSMGWNVDTNHWRHVYDFSPPAPGAPPNWTLIPVEKQTLHRWCELQFHAEGLAGGTVTETRGITPSVEGCECPCAACDGSLYRAPWYSGPSVVIVNGSTRLDIPAVEPERFPSSASLSDKNVGLFQRLVNWLLAFFSGGVKKESSKVPTSDFVAPKPIAPGEITTQTTMCSLQ